MRIHLVATAFAALIACVACGSSSDGTNGNGATDDGGVASHDASDASSSSIDGAAASDGSTSTGTDASSGADASAPPPTNCDASACGSLVGKVLRVATTKPQHGGIGNVYVAVFDGDPITNQQTARVVARTLLMNVDLSADTAQVAYRVDGIPTRAVAYQVVAFLDDDHNASPTSPGPSSGDLASIDIASFGGIQATVATTGDTMLNLTLNAAVP